MSNDVTSKVILGLDPSEFRRGIQKVDAQLKQTSKLLSNLGAAVGAAFAVSQIQAFASETVALGSQLQTVGRGFARFGNEMQLEQLRQATRGLVTDLELMKVTVQAGNFGIPIEQMGNLLEFATRRAAETGQEVDYLVNSIITGIGRKSPLILDNLGISVTRLKEKFGGAALEAQSIADVSRAVGDIAAEELGKMGVAADTASDKMKRLGTTWQNFKASFGEATAPVANFVLEGITNTLNGLMNMGESLNKFGVATGTAKPSDLIKKQGATAAPQATTVTEVQRTIVTLESLRAKIKELEAEYATTEVGTKRFAQLRAEIEKVNYELGRASGETWNGAKQQLIELEAKGLTPVNNALAYQDRIIKSSLIPAYDEMALMVKGARAQLEETAQTMEKAAMVGAQFGHILTAAFVSSMETGEDFFDALRRSLINYTKQIAVALAVTTALAAVFSVVTGKSFTTAFKGVAKGTGLGFLFGDDGLFSMSATVKGSDLKLGTNRSDINLSRSGG